MGFLRATIRSFKGGNLDPDCRGDRRHVRPWRVLSRGALRFNSGEWEITLDTYTLTRPIRPTLRDGAHRRHERGAPDLHPDARAVRDKDGLYFHIYAEGSSPRSASCWECRISRLATPISISASS